MHANASRGFLKTGLSVALDGSQDEEICVIEEKELASEEEIGYDY